MKFMVAGSHGLPLTIYAEAASLHVVTLVQETMIIGITNH
jgi:hypothetical protein